VSQLLPALVHHDGDMNLELDGDDIFEAGVDMEEDDNGTYSQSFVSTSEKDACCRTCGIERPG